MRDIPCSIHHSLYFEQHFSWDASANSKLVKNEQNRSQTNPNMVLIKSARRCIGCITPYHTAIAGVATTAIAALNNFFTLLEYCIQQ
jgi:hypothetical protein